MPKPREDEILSAKGHLDELADALALESALIASVFSATVHLTTEQIADLHNTGVAVVPAPGVGKYLKALGMSGKMNAGTAPFGGGSDIRLVYGTDGSVGAHSFKAGSVIDAATDKLWDGIPASSSLVLDPADMENKPLCVKLQDAANPATGPIAAFTITNGGSGHEPTDELSVSNVSTGVDATIIVDTVDGGGAILTAHIGNAGSGYTVENGATAGSEGAATINITDVTEPPAGNGSLDVTVLYAEIPV